MINSLPENDAETFLKENILTEKPIIALLPGSRKQEIKTMLLVMLTVVDDLPDYQFVVAGAPSQEKSLYENIIGKSNVKLIEGQTHNLLQNAYAALVTSGTATLETALFEVPEVVCYKGSFISYQIARRVVDQSIIKFISLVNLIMDRGVVKELIQKDFNTSSLRKELSRILSGEEYRSQMSSDFKELKQKLGGPGASEKTAGIIIQNLQKD